MLSRESDIRSNSRVRKRWVFSLLAKCHFPAAYGAYTSTNIRLTNRDAGRSGAAFRRSIWQKGKGKPKVFSRKDVGLYFNQCSIKLGRTVSRYDQRIFSIAKSTCKRIKGDLVAYDAACIPIGRTGFQRRVLSLTMVDPRIGSRAGAERTRIEKEPSKY